MSGSGSSSLLVCTRVEKYGILALATSICWMPQSSTFWALSIHCFSPRTNGCGDGRVGPLPAGPGCRRVLQPWFERRLKRMGFWYWPRSSACHPSRQCFMRCPSIVFLRAQMAKVMEELDHTGLHWLCHKEQELQAMQLTCKEFEY